MKIISRILGLALLINTCLAIVLQMLAPQNIWLVNGCWIFSGALAIAWIVLNRAMLTRFFTQKSTLYGANLGLIVVMVLGILIFINVLAKDFNWRKDITRSGLNSLSPQTLKILQDLRQDVKVHYFNSAQEKKKWSLCFGIFRMLPSAFNTNL